MIQVVQYILCLAPGLTCEEFPLPANESQISKFLRRLAQPVAPVDAVCEPVTPETASACLPYQLEILPDGFPVYQQLTGQV